MNILNLIFIFCSSLVYILLYNVNRIINYPLINLCALEKCPFCYGTDLCDEFENGKFEFKISSFENVIANLFSVKNVYYAIYKNRSVVLKKLAHDYELDELDQFIHENYVGSRISNKDILEILYPKGDLIGNNYVVENFHLCTHKTAENFFQQIKWYEDPNEVIEQVWYTIKVNVEPLLLKILSSKVFPIPKYLGACGRIIVEENRGQMLSNFYYADWQIRTNISVQLLKAAEVFTEKHDLFRFYLTDISPDNIAVDANMTITFVDLENIIITNHLASGVQSIHHSVDMESDDGFAFSPNEICSHSLSDHNYYAICKLLLSESAPWPMVKGGFLHSPPVGILLQFPKLFELVELCVHPNAKINRFDAAKEITDILEKALQFLNT
ncbi:hypothetical protein ILUMI_07225 [Ignelater luminosus]|uniref:FAM69 protein-kinase domain-containing protein n=1 Tax=Ignelater luminosus TaxID=2038154 RepID=A0A8K0GGI8_IGNLU|nr:hypothetical protein ILUMI_07225 [Ignelater luminosus]